MSIYIFKNNQQSGPFEESKILEWLGSGQLMPNDMAVRKGDTQWQPLSVLFPNVPRNQTAFQYASQAGVSTAAAINQQNSQKKTKSKLLPVLLGLFALGIVGFGVVGFIFISKSRTTENSVVSTNSGSSNSSSSNTNSANGKSIPSNANYAELEAKLKEFATLKPPVKLETNPMLNGKVLVVEQRDRDNEYSLRMSSSSDVSRYGLSSERLATNLKDLDTLIQISCGKGKEIGKYGPRMAYVPAYSNICNVSVIDYRAMKTIAQKTFVNGKKPVTIHVSDDENEFILDPPMEDVEKYLNGLAKS